jgi:hypothetical protein
VPHLIVYDRQILPDNLLDVDENFAFRLTLRPESGRPGTQTLTPSSVCFEATLYFIAPYDSAVRTSRTTL